MWQIALRDGGAGDSATKKSPQTVEPPLELELHCTTFN